MPGFGVNRRQRRRGGGEVNRRGQHSSAERRARGAKQRSRKSRAVTMKALLLLVLPWLSPANYTDNLGNLHILYSEL